MARRQAANVTRHPSVDHQSGARRQPVTVVRPTGAGYHDHAPRPGPPSPWRHTHGRLACVMFAEREKLQNSKLRSSVTARQSRRCRAAVIRIARQAGSARSNPTGGAAGAQGRRWRNRAGLADTGADCTGGEARDQASVTTATEHEVLLTGPSRCAVVGACCCRGGMHLLPQGRVEGAELWARSGCSTTAWITGGPPHVGVPRRPHHPAANPCLGEVPGRGLKVDQDRRCSGDR
jgi:hypothetical protein